MKALKPEMDTPSPEEIVRLRMELQARTAEAAWLKAHYGQHLALARARMATEGSAAPLPPTSAPAPAPAAPAAAELVELASLRTQVENLQSQVHRLKEGERRYLDRIDELKKTLAHLRSGTKGS